MHLLLDVEFNQKRKNVSFMYIHTTERSDTSSGATKGPMGTSLKEGKDKCGNLDEQSRSNKMVTIKIIHYNYKITLMNFINSSYTVYKKNSDFFETKSSSILYKKFENNK